MRCGRSGSLQKESQVMRCVVSRQGEETRLRKHIVVLAADIRSLIRARVVHGPGVGPGYFARLFFDEDRIFSEDGAAGLAEILPLDGRRGLAHDGIGIERAGTHGYASRTEHLG